MKYLLLCFCALAVTLLSVTPGRGQQVSQMNFSTVHVDDLSDAQIRQFMDQVHRTGMTDAQIDQVALAKGLPPAELQKLKARISRLSLRDSTRITQASRSPSDTLDSVPSNFTFGASDTLSERYTRMEAALDVLRPKIFGEELFSNPHMTFEPNLNIPTPPDYQIGPGDQIDISIYGYSQADYQLPVSKEGSINIPYVGVVPVNGLTMEAATQRIKTKLTQVYSGIKSGNTSVQVSLGQVRGIRITVMGEATQPGTYTLPSLATVFNALYAAGGPGENGSYRDIELIRGGKVIQHLDVYGFLMRGDMGGSEGLRNGDLIRIPPYEERVQLLGQVKRPGIYEMKPGETMQNLLNYAGGFSDSAYTAMIHAVRMNGKEKTVSDVPAADFGSFQPRSGDKYFVSSVIDRFTNRVIIDGAVYRPGPYELTDGLTLSGLVKKADGLREDAFLPRGYLVRQNPDLTTSAIQFDVAGIMQGKEADISLKKEDVVHIYSIFDLRDQYSVSITGSVRDPGNYDYSDKMSLEDLIMQAGGFTEGASPRRIEVSRRFVDTANAGTTSAHIAQVFEENVDKDLQLHASNFKLQPYDIVSIRDMPGFETQKQVKVQGEVMYPGTYTLIQKNETIADLVKRAGGLTGLAYPQGASLKRTLSADSSAQARLKMQQFQKLQGTVLGDTSELRNMSNLVVQNNFVGIHLDKILQQPDSREDLFLQGGDVLYVPRKLQTVKINGEVLYPVITPYQQSRKMKYYVSQAGGFSTDAKKNRVYVVYANGFVKSTHNFLFFKNYPSVKPGAEVFVPLKPRNKMSAQQVLGITSGASALALAIVAILNILK